MNRDPTTRFSDRVEDYVRYRPRYPSGFVALLRDRIGLEPEWVVADIGSGTGFSALPFLEHGNTVIGVEPNAAMRAAAASVLSGCHGYTSVDGSAESTGLPDGAVDLVACGQAFHWFDAPRARLELLRILRPPAWTVLFWNTRHIATTSFLRAYEALLQRHGTDYGGVRHDRQGDDALANLLGPSFERHVLPNVQHLAADAFIGRLLSSSYTPAAGDSRREALLREARALFKEHAREGHVQMDYDTEIYAGTLG